MNQYDKQKLLRYIDAVSFALIDTNLYLDTHPDDSEALAHFHEYQKARTTAVKEYSKYFEPLNLATTDTTGTFSWAVAPWPWQKGAC